MDRLTSWNWASVSAPSVRPHDRRRLVRDGPSIGFLRPALQCLRLPSGTAVLGVTLSGTPCLLTLGETPPFHLRICGRGGCGKSELLRACLMSLSWSTTPEALGIMAIDPSGRQLGMVDSLPQGRLEPVTEMRRARALLDWLADEVRQRLRSGVRTTSWVLAVEDLSAWADSWAVRARVRWLRQRGGPAGVHVLDIVSSEASTGGSRLGIDRASTRDAAVASCTGAIGSFDITSGGHMQKVQALWLPVRDLAACLDDVRAGVFPASARQDHTGSPWLERRR